MKAVCVLAKLSDFNIFPTQLDELAGLLEMNRLRQLTRNVCEFPGP